MAKSKMRFSAINPVVETLQVSAEATEIRGKDYMAWGRDNTYPQYIASLRDAVPTLASVISGFADFICGNDVTLNVELVPGHPGWVDTKGTTINEIIRGFAEDLATYNGFAPEVIRNYAGGIAEIKRLPFMDCRTDKENQAVFYSESWAAKYNRADKVLVLPVFSRDLINDDSVLYVKADTYGVYPQPTCAPALIACELEKSIDQYHLTAINSSFMGSYLVNFNNGMASEEEMDEVERTFNEKYSGKENAGRIIFSWNEGMTNRTTLEELKTEDFGEKYKTLAERSRQQIFTAFRANPNLFGISTAQGFNSEEYESSFKLFNRTMVRPMQRLICDTFDKILGMQGSLTFQPFSLETETETNVR